MGCDTAVYDHDSCCCSAAGGQAVSLSYRGLQQDMQGPKTGFHQFQADVGCIETTVHKHKTIVDDCKGNNLFLGLHYPRPALGLLFVASKQVFPSRIPWITSLEHQASILRHFRES